MSKKIITYKKKLRENYTYLNQRERFVIEEKLKKKIKIPVIADSLNRSISTIYNEINRSGLNKENYNSLIAEDKFAERMIGKKDKLKAYRILNKDKSLLEKIINLLKKKNSPLVISKILLKQGVKINYNTIYNYGYYLL